MLLITLLANRYALGAAAVTIFAVPVVRQATEILNSVAVTLAALPL